MEVCYEIHLEGDRAMNISATPVIDSADYSARSSTCGNENNGKIILVYDHCKKQWHIKEHCYKLHGCPQEIRNALPTRNRTHGGHM